MKIYSTEEEQVQALRDWFKKHGVTLLIVIMFSLSGFFMWNYWKNTNASYLQQASALYDDLQKATVKDKQTQIANKLFNDYKSTVYGKIAALYLTNQKVEDKDWLGAAKDYEWIYNNTSTWPDVQVVVLENWLRSLLEANQVDEALNLLAKEEKSNKYSNSYALNYYNLLGDILAKKGSVDEALDSYNKAIDYADSNPSLKQQMGQFVNWITLKRNDLLSPKAPT